MAAVSKTANPSALVVVGRFRSTKTGILPFGFRVLMNRDSFCLLVRIDTCSTLGAEVTRMVNADSASQFRLTHMQLCRRISSSAPRDRPRLSSRLGYHQCRG